MIEAVICVVSLAPQDLPRNGRRGDMLELKDAGWVWSPKELLSAKWRIVVLDALFDPLYEEMMSTVVGSDDILFRGRYFDLDSLPWWDAEVQQRTGVSTLSTAQSNDLLAAIKSYPGINSIVLA